MVVLNTKFQVNSDFTRQEMYRLIREWMDDSYFCDDKIRNESEKFDFKTDTFQTATEDGSIQMTVDSYDDTFAIEVVNRDENSIFKTDYILKDKLEQPMFLCVQDKSSTGMNASIQTGAKLPKVLRSIFWNEFCGEDNGLRIDDRPYVLRKQDVPFAVEVLNNKNQYDLPIIYVSPDKSGRYSLNYELLASEMVGEAHVMIEG